MWVSHLRDEYRFGQRTDKTWQERRQDKKGYASEKMRKQRKIDREKIQHHIDEYYE